MNEKDPTVVARNLIEDKNLETELSSLVSQILASQKDAEQQCKSLDSVGSGFISAPDILNAVVCPRLVEMRKFLDTCISQCEGAAW